MRWRASIDLFRSIPRPEVLGATFGSELSRLLQVVIDLQSVEDRLIHVEVLVRCEAADEAHPFLLLRQFTITFVEGAVVRVGHRVVRVTLRRGDLLRDERALHLALLHRIGLVRYVLVLDDPRELRVRRRVVDDHRLLEEAIRWLLDPLLDESQRAVLEPRHPLLCEVGVDRPCVYKHPILGELVGRPRLEKVAVEPDGDIRVLEKHVLEDTCVAVDGECLPLVAEVTVVRGGAARQPHQDRRVELRRVLVPLLLGVVLEDALVQPRAHAG
mmetsp:Transcript_8979/g.22270  ORF Transcript_8979/g.22270 Transcript_8979/m.22270 type:complete len:271 (+) Transcript_8979:647-1459(+)